MGCDVLHSHQRPRQRHQQLHLPDRLFSRRVVAGVLQVYGALCSEAGGNYNASLEEVVARMARAKVGIRPPCTVLRPCRPMRPPQPVPRHALLHGLGRRSCVHCQSLAFEY